MSDLKSFMISNKAQITAVLFVLIVAIGGGLALAKYQQHLTDKQVAENVSEAKHYLAERQKVNKQFDDINYAQISKNSNLQPAVNNKACTSLEKVAKRAGKIGDFDAKQSAKDNAVVKQAKSASEKYSTKRAEKDIKNLADVCARQTSIGEFVDAMNSASDKMSPTSEEFYKKSYQLTSNQAKSLSKSCPYTYIHQSGQKICDNQVEVMEKYAEANKLVVDAIAAGKSPMSVADKAYSLYDEADKPLDNSVYKQVLGEDATAETFVPKYVALLSQRIQSL